MKLKIDFENTLKKHLSSGINLFIGSGFSVHASSELGSLPAGNALKGELLIEFPNSPSSLELPQLCTYLSRSKKEELDSYLRKRFNVTSFEREYEKIENIQIKNIFTTNIDNLIQKIFNSSKKKYINDVDYNGASYNKNSAIDLYHLHGSISNPDSELIFRDLDISKIVSSEPARWTHLSRKMIEFPTIFWGYSMNDAGTLATLSDVLKDSGRKDSWIVVKPEPGNDDQISYFKSLGLSIIESNTLDFLRYFDKIYPENTDVKSLDLDEFKNILVPSNAQVTHREIKEFFQGATPVWSDAYSKRVIKTTYFRKIKDMLDGDKNVLITGAAATGKSTLLMQMATDYETPAFKFFVKDLTKEQLHQIENKIGSNGAIFFIDDSQSSLEAISLISNNSSYKFIAAERDYAYLSSSNHAFFHRNIDIIDITDISEEDVQSIYDSIPYDIRRVPLIQKKEGESIFELIEQNCTSSNIRDRFTSVIKQLDRIDSKLVELFVLICYLHRSRSVASMDILISYFQDNQLSYKEIYSLVEGLGRNLAEHDGSLLTYNQDAYLVRSNILADLISNLAPVNVLAQVLRRFHTNVSRYSIPVYDIFKRKAYDARLFEKAFPNIKDGIAIYDVIYKKHPSPFNLQQKALYLSRRGDHQEAFKVIDEAVAHSGSKNWAIKNSYAIIKFRANIDRDMSDEVRLVLDDSLNTLKECYSSDIRKVFHAMTFADHALRYFDKYADDTAFRYLVQAKEWLEDEINPSNKVHDVKRLLKRCKSAIFRYG
ncbi:hypothetical protein AGRI_13076 [Alishewanella agri BL06]|uniref:Novel STAND NTPase 5 domain-containing protein n=1 Tax=Alishewanella agri BL06 TaxID=1195246 RepID=I9P082_9ALTE|nr:SIR2 family protein [Alishewanella agri]EIW88139.1 hypothetical protein AGRI_13076 [Alishewanella agri BL06]